jgi:hypothetical protein
MLNSISIFLLLGQTAFTNNDVLALMPARVVQSLPVLNLMFRDTGYSSK